MKKIFISFLAVFFIFVFHKAAWPQIQFQGNNYLEYAIDQESDKYFFEDWTDAYLSYNNWRLGARYEMHLPPQDYSQDTTGQGISQRFLEYHTGNLTVTVGNYYALFGRGLVLRSFDNRMLRWDTNIDGIKFEYYDQYLNVKLLGGRPRNRSGRRFEPLQGGEIKLKPSGFFQLGGSLVTTELSGKGRVNWGSFFGELYLPWGTFYLERAIKDYPDRFPEGKALYASGNLYFDAVFDLFSPSKLNSFFTPFNEMFDMIRMANVLVEYRDYDQFDLTEGLTYNNPPAVVREHLYTLLNRHQRVQDANDEKGYLVEISTPVLDMGVLTLNHSRTENHDGLLLYREYYGQLEVDPYDEINLVAGSGQQKDLEASYLNFVGTAKWAFADYTGMKMIYEHQQVEILLTERQFYNQALTLSLEKAPRFTLSLLTERSTDQISERDLWIGGQLDLHFLDTYDLTIFGGRRREGKICVGGVCIFRPPFEGVEFRLINRF